jgi:hypothetical protein
MQPSLFPIPTPAGSWGDVRAWSVRMVRELDRWDRPELAALRTRADLAARRALTVDEAIALGIEAIGWRRRLAES